MSGAVGSNPNLTVRGLPVFCDFSNLFFKSSTFIISSTPLDIIFYLLFYTFHFYSLPKIIIFFVRPYAYGTCNIFTVFLDLNFNFLSAYLYKLFFKLFY